MPENLGRIAAAGMVYAANDANEMAIPAHPLMGFLDAAVGVFEWGGKSGRSEPVVGSDPLSSKWGTWVGRGPATRGLNHVIYGRVFEEYRNNPGTNASNWLYDTKLNLDVFRCPADSGYTGFHFSSWRESGLTSYDHYGNSYFANGLWARAYVGGCRLLSLGSFLRPITRVPNPANTILVMDNAGAFAWRHTIGESNCPGGAQPDRRIAGWHGQDWTFNAAFTDGHTASIVMKGHRIPQPDLGRYPNVPISDDPAGYDFYRCGIIRGDGWQMDTLPSPPVQTNVGCSQFPGVLLD